MDVIVVVRYGGEGGGENKLPPSGYDHFTIIFWPRKVVG